MAKEKIKIRLQGHEKFALREGWLNKGIMQVVENPTIFQGKEGPDVFGIGSNMVKSLRYWMKAFGLMSEKSSSGVALTSYGEIINKYDVYFEDMFTLWILHSNIVKNIEEATAWSLFFNKCDVEELSKEQIVQIMIRELNRYTHNATFSEKSLRNDIDIILNMYGKVKEITDPEDKNISPLAQLNLIKESEGYYTKVQPDRRTISEWVVLYEVAGYLQNREYVSIDELSEGNNSLKAIYQLNSVAINNFLDKLDSMEYIRVDRTAGLDMVYKVTNISKEMVMEDYYKNHR